MSLALALRRANGFGDWFDDLYPQVGDDGIIRINSQPAYPGPGLPPNAERNVRRIDGLIVEANGSIWQLPPGAVPPGPMSDRDKELWLIGVGARIISPANLSAEERASLNEQNRAFDEQAKQANESPLETVLRKAREAVNAGGEAAEDALKLLAENGDFFAKIALGLGISYAVASMAVAAVGAVALVVVLKMK